MSLHVDDLRVYYRTLAGDVKALDGVTFDVADGEIMGLAGESGCGKSTLGKSLIRLDGRMRYVGGHVGARRAGAADLGRRGDESIPVPGRLDRAAVRDERAQPDPQDRPDDRTSCCARAASTLRTRRSTSCERRLELVGLERDVLDLYPIELSGGMKQRIVMVISTLLDPSLLIADEITSALDVSTQKAVAETLVEFRDRGFVKSMIVVTHDIVDPVPDRGHDPRHVRGQARREGVGRGRSSRAPRHPYTRLLVSSLPEVGVRYAEKKLTGIPGRPPPLLEPPTGCRFRDRCPLATARCERGASLGGGGRTRRRLLGGDAGTRNGRAAGRKGSLMLRLDHVSKTYRVGSFGAAGSPQFAT